MRADGHILVAAISPPANDVTVEIWDASSGELLRTLESPDRVRVACAAWGTAADGRQMLATGCHNGTAMLWDPDTGELLHTLATGSGVAWSIAWGYRPDGQPALAVGSYGWGTRIWNPDSGQVLASLTTQPTAAAEGLATTPASMAWGRQPDGQLLLATGGYEGIARIWDPATGELLRTLTGHSRTVWSVAWGLGPDGRPLLATASEDGTTRIWDLATGQTLRTISDQSRYVFWLDWVELPDGRQILACVGGDDTTRLWDPVTGAELASVRCRGGHRQAIALVPDAAGDLVMVTGNPDPDGGPLRLWRIATGLPTQTSDAAVAPGGHPPLVAESTRQLPRLAANGLCPPLGLLADLLELTAGPAGPPPAPDELCDGRLAALSAEPGITRLRELDWAPAARVSFAALLASALTIPERYAPPPDAAAAALRDALALALAERTGAVQTGHIPVSEIRAAAAVITERAVALLSILGSAACAAEPLLPVRLAHRIPQLPALSAREMRLLTDAGARRDAAGHDLATGTLRHSPGTAGLARSGPLTRLLPSQLALPHDVLTIRLAESQLLYRQHHAPAPPAPEPVTLILDTTPPTYGPAGTTLRLAAHLIATTLWEHDRYPLLVTLTEPASAIELRHPADLLRIWASSTLAEPAAALVAALRTAAETGQPALLATHRLTARDAGYRPGPATRLLTAHHPPEQPPLPSASRWHHHLPPNPTQAQLIDALGELLGGHPADRS